MPPPLARPSSRLLALVFLIALIKPTSSSFHPPSFSLNKRWPSDNPPAQDSTNSTANVSATPQPITSPADYACRPIGPCQPCPPEELESPVCKVYQNRRVVDCLYLGIAATPDQPSAGSPTRRADGDSASELDGSHQNEIGEGGGGAEFQTGKPANASLPRNAETFLNSSPATSSSHCSRCSSTDSELNSSSPNSMVIWQPASESYLPEHPTKQTAS